MKLSDFTVARAACAYFFFGPGLAYGLLTSRLPALKIQTGADEMQIGLILLSLGLAALVTLLSGSWLIDRWGSRTMLRLGSAALLLTLPLCGAAATPFHLGLACGVFGLSTGLTDISMNAQGIQLERRHHSPCMSFLHASYSLGCVLASLTGALFAALEVSPLIHFSCILALYACIRPFAVPRIQKDTVTERTVQERSSRIPPFFIIACGLLAMCTYAAAGSAAEWGSLLLFTVKGAGEHTSALVLGVFAASTALFRLIGDWLRNRVGDFRLAFGGSLLAALAMGVVLASPWPALCLAGYACMGAGLSIIVPILFSRAGTYPGVTPGEASAVISVLAYSGLLFFPPTLGWLAHRVGLANALLVVFALCWILCAGTLLLRTGKKRPSEALNASEGQ